jgi:hypothetical protein
VAFLDFFKQVVFILCPEGVISLQHNVIENAQRPHVSIHWDMIDFGHNLRGHVSRSATKSVDLFAFAASETEAKINEFQLFVPVEQNIFGFDVPMDNIEFMQIQ